MNSLNLILILIIGVLVTGAFGSQCKQIVKSPEVNFTQVFDVAPWYMTYSIRNHLISHNNTPPDIDCIFFTGGKVLTDKIVIYNNNDNNGSSIASDFEIWHNQTGIYYVSQKSMAENINDALILEGSEKGIQGKDISVGGKRSLILTDYFNYLTTTTCSSEGDWVIVMHTPTPFATAEQLNLARNKLAEHGICTQIFPSNCDKLAKKELLK